MKTRTKVFLLVLALVGWFAGVCNHNPENVIVNYVTIWINGYCFIFWAAVLFFEHMAIDTKHT